MCIERDKIQPVPRRYSRVLDETTMRHQTVKFEARVHKTSVSILLVLSILYSQSILKLLGIMTHLDLFGCHAEFSDENEVTANDTSTSRPYLKITFLLYIFR